IANMLAAKPVQADPAFKPANVMSSFEVSRLARLKGLAPALKPGTRPATVEVATAQAPAPKPSAVAPAVAPAAPIIVAALAPTTPSPNLVTVEPAAPAAPAVAAVATPTPSAASAKFKMQPILKPGTGDAPVALAAAPALAPDSQATTVVWRPDGDYGIQVGAYSKYNAAQKAAQTATNSESLLLADARIIIDTQKMNNGSKVYRARVAGLSKRDAQTACSNLKAKRTDCLVLKIDPTLAMGN